MKISDLKEADNSQEDLDNVPGVDPELRRALHKLANKDRLRRDEIMILVQAFEQLIQMEPQDVALKLRLLKRLYK